MEMEKILNLSDGELVQQERQAAEQLFRLRFQMRMGQNDGVQKLRGLKKDVARIKTVARQRQLGIVTHHAASSTQDGAKVEKAAKAKTVKAAKSQVAKPKAVKVARTASAKPVAAKPTKVSAKSKAASSKAAGGKVQSNAMKGSR